MLVPQNRIVKGAGREYLNVMRCLACYGNMDGNLAILLSFSHFDILGFLVCADRVGRLWAWGGHANLYNGLPLSLNAKPQ
jgi:hypothetical protein